MVADQELFRGHQAGNGAPGSSPSLVLNCTSAALQHLNTSAGDANRGHGENSERT